MKKRSHIIFGALLSFIFIYLAIYLGIGLFDFSWVSVLAISAIIVFYSLLPDIDHKNSTITWFFFGIGVLGLVIAIIEMSFGINKINPLTIIILSTALLALTFLLPNIFEHRGIIHSIPVGVLSAVPLYFIFHSLFYCLLAYVAFHSHLLGDGYLFKFK